MASNSSIAPLLQKIETAASAQALVDAVTAVAETRSEEAIEPLIKALGYNNPGAAVAAVDGLIQIGTPAVSPLLELLDSYNYGARAWTIRALAGIGDPRGLEILLDAASNDFALSVRRAAARGLGTVQWSTLPVPDQIEGQSRCLAVLLQAATDPEWVVRYGAIAGIESLSRALAQTQPQRLAAVLAQLDDCFAQESTLAVRARILLAQQHIALLT